MARLAWLTERAARPARQSARAARSAFAATRDAGAPLPPPPPHQRGMTLIELVVSIVVISVGLAGVLGVFNLVIRHSADPLLIKQTQAVADALLEEILLKDFCDPTPRRDVNATLVAGSTGVTDLFPSLDLPAATYAGWRVFGEGIPAGTTIASAGPPSSLTLSVAASAAGIGRAVSFAPCVARQDADETGRGSFDDVRDYDDDAAWKDAVDITGATIFTPTDAYQTRVRVELMSSATLGTAGASVAENDILRVTVRAKAPDGQVIEAAGYRYFYD